MNKIKKGNLIINSALVDFVNHEAIIGTDISAEDFWHKLDNAVHELAPINKRLIEKRKSIQKQIDEWHLARKDKKIIKS